MDTEKLNRWAKEIHDNATAHGWHEEKHSPEHYLALVMCDVAKAVEADRKGLYSKAKICYATKDSFCDWYNHNVKCFLEEGFADIVIRLLDMGADLYEIEWVNYDILIRAFSGVYFKRDASFVENAWIFVRHQLGAVPYDVLKSIQFMYMWAEHLGIDLDQHIEWKMKYNKHRSYKHGGKKY